MLLRNFLQHVRLQYIITCYKFFANKGIDALNLSNILNQKYVLSNITPYFQNKDSPCITYSYTRSVTSKFLQYECFILRAVRLSNKHLGQGYVKERLRSSLRKFYGMYGDLIKKIRGRPLPNVTRHSG